MSQLSIVLKQRRKELGLTLAQIADQMGVAEATVQRWESGNIKSVRYDKLNRLAEVLGVQPYALMGWEEISSAEQKEEEKYSLSEPALTEGELELLELFRRVPEDRQDHVLELIRLALKIQ
jgi:transcriptional regulator with XRE-family HTH domain